VEQVGIRDLKAHLSRHLERVRAGARLVVTDRGRAIAAISRIEVAAVAPVSAWADRLVAGGRAQWAGGKPTGGPRGIALASGRTLSDTVLEDRR
jgi:prevent-host-death family protein